jgi:hypothetical protein
VIYLALALVLFGVILGGAGMKRLAGLARGTWRPGAALLAIVAFASGLLMAVRGAWLEAGLLLAAAFGLAFSARTRRGAAAPSQAAMSRREAASILGVEADAPLEQIEDAYRRLIRRTHPDHGGSPGLAAQLNAARQALTRPPARRGRTTGRGAQTS